MIYPKAIVQLIPKHNQVKMTRYDRAIFHVAAADPESLFGFFSGSSNCSHFYVNENGTVYQYIDTKFKSKADLNGSSTSISVETAGATVNATVNTEQWNSKQVEALTELWQWIRDTHGIKNKLATDSRPGDSSCGLAWHRLGVPGYAVSGGVLWSSARGKACPGTAKIAQIPGIFNAANKPNVKSTTQGEDFLMALTDAQQLKLLQAAETIQRAFDTQQNSRVAGSTVKMWATDAIFNADASGYRNEKNAEKILNILTTPVPSAVSGSKVTISPVDLWRNADAYGYRNEQHLAALQATIATLATAVANQNGISADDLKATIQEAIAAAVVKVDVSVNGQS